MMKKILYLNMITLFTGMKNESVFKNENTYRNNNRENIIVAKILLKQLITYTCRLKKLIKLNIENYTLKDIKELICKRLGESLNDILFENNYLNTQIYKEKNNLFFKKNKLENKSYDKLKVYLSEISKFIRRNRKQINKNISIEDNNTFIKIFSNRIKNFLQLNLSGMKEENMELKKENKSIESIKKHETSNISYKTFESEESDYENSHESSPKKNKNIIKNKKIYRKSKFNKKSNENHKNFVKVEISKQSIDTDAIIDLYKNYKIYNNNNNNNNNTNPIKKLSEEKLQINNIIFNDTKNLEKPFSNCLNKTNNSLNEINLSDEESLKIPKKKKI
jgi:hypothetical protein